MLHLYSQMRQARYFGNSSPTITSFLPYLQLSARVSCPLASAVILFAGARSKPEGEPWHCAPAPGSLASLTGSCWPVQSCAWHDGVPHGGKKASQQSQISFLQVWKHLLSSAEPAEEKVISVPANIPGCLQQEEILPSCYPDYYFYPFSFFLPHKPQHQFYPEYAMGRGKGKGKGEKGEKRRLFSGWQAEASPSWSLGTFWPKMISCKPVCLISAEGHKCISR